QPGARRRDYAHSLPGQAPRRDRAAAGRDGRDRARPGHDSEAVLLRRLGTMRPGTRRYVQSCIPLWGRRSDMRLALAFLLLAIAALPALGKELCLTDSS